jgi:hypothetical protein
LLLELRRIQRTDGDVEQLRQLGALLDLLEDTVNDLTAHGRRDRDVSRGTGKPPHRDDTVVISLAPLLPAAAADHELGGRAGVAERWRGDVWSEQWNRSASSHIVEPAEGRLRGQWWDLDLRRLVGDANTRSDTTPDPRADALWLQVRPGDHQTVPCSGTRHI